MELLFTATDAAEAQLLKAALGDAAIPAAVHEENPLAGIWFVAAAMPRPQVFVRARDLPAALDVLEEFLSNALSQDSPEDWRCAACGETVEGAYALCWNCQASRPDTPPA